VYWDSLHETMPRGELEALQVERLQHKVREVYERVPFYRSALDDARISPIDIRSLADIQRLPFTTKADFREQYPYGLFAVPRSEIVRVHGSSGTTGKLTLVGYTKNDVRLWSEVMARALVMGGVTPEDVIHNAYGYGLFTGGLGIHYGAERIGCMVIPLSGGNVKRQIMLMQDLQSTVLCCTPSFALYLAQTARELSVEPEQLPLRVGIFGAEPWTAQMRVEIEAKLSLTALDIYGLSEIIGPGVAQECGCKGGLHIAEDHFYPEIIDSGTGEVLPDGARGELVLTTLTKEGLPVLRYRTRDITALHRERCGCGRTLVRMDRISGRTDDMLIVRGVNVFPSQIESVLLEVEGVQPHYQIFVDRARHSLDELEIWVEVSEDVFSDELSRLESLRRKVQNEIESVLGIRAAVRLVEPKTIQRSEGKAARVIDRRST
jgi:phenylacetate-CoA ligase